MTRALPLLLVGALGLALALPAGARPPRILVAAGNNVGAVGELPLEHAAKDARRVAEVFTSLGDVPGDRALVVQDGSPEALRAALRKAASLAARYDDATLIVYFSGHGDADHLHMAGEKLRVRELQDLVAAVPADLRLVFLDACRTGAGRAKGLVADAPFAISLQGAKGPSGTVTVRSSSDGEASQESDALGGAVFTHYLVSGLRGAADANRDRQVTFAEAYDFAYSRTLRRSVAGSGALQHPTLDVDLEGAGPVVLTRTGRANARLVLPPAKDAIYLVYDERSGSVLAEAWSKPDAPVEVALPAGRFVVQRRAADQHGAASVALPWGGSEVVAADAFAPVPLDLMVAKGGSVFGSRHELAAGYGLVGQLDRGLGHAVRLRYAHVWSAWALALGVDLGLSDYSSALSNTIEERWIGGGLHLERREPIGPLTLTLGIGGGLRYVDQTLTWADAARLGEAGLETQTAQGALAGGPELQMRVALPISASVSWELGTTGRLLMARQREASLTADTTREGDGGIELLWSLTAETGMAVTF